jgi:hypothetical protein
VIEFSSLVLNGSGVKSVSYLWLYFFWVIWVRIYGVCKDKWFYIRQVIIYKGHWL